MKFAAEGGWVEELKRSISVVGVPKPISAPKVGPTAAMPVEPMF